MPKDTLGALGALLCTIILVPSLFGEPLPLWASLPFTFGLIVVMYMWVKEKLK
jgi:hypothetical protein